MVCEIPDVHPSLGALRVDLGKKFSGEILPLLRALAMPQALLSALVIIKIRIALFSCLSGLLSFLSSERIFERPSAVPTSFWAMLTLYSERGKVRFAVIFGKEEAGFMAFIFLINLPTKEKKKKEKETSHSALYHKGILDLFQVDIKETLCSFQHK